MGLLSPWTCTAEAGEDILKQEKWEKKLGERGKGDLSELLVYGP